MGCSSSKESATGGDPMILQSRDVQSPAQHSQAGSRMMEQQLSSLPRNPSQINVTLRATRPNKLSKAKRPDGNTHGAWPKVLDGQGIPFTVYVFSHEIAYPPKNLSCWTFVSQGLHQRNQPEIVFTILRRAKEDPERYPEAAVEWMKLVYGMAGSGLNLETGQMCELVFERGATHIKLDNYIFPQVAGRWDSMRNFGGIVHGISMAGVLTGVPASEIRGGSHTVIALTYEEAAVAKQFGVTRVVGHVGLAVRWFPHPPFIDRDRNDCVNMADQAGSFRTKLPIARLYGFGGMQMNDDIVLTIPAGEETRDKFRQLVQSTPENDPLAFETFMSTDADAGFIWKAGQTEMMMYGSDCAGGSISRINLGYIAFAIDDKHDSIDSWSMVEDGYGVIVRPSTWKAIQSAMLNTQDIVVSLQRDTERMRFCLKWTKTVYYDPIDGTAVHAPWTVTRPTGPPSKDAPSWPHIKMSSIMFLPTPPPSHCDTQDLLKYTLQVMNIVAAAIPISPVPMQGSPDVGRQLIVELHFPKCEGWLKVAFSPTSEGLSFEQMLTEIARIVQPQTLSAFKLQLFIDLWGHQSEGLRLS